MPDNVELNRGRGGAVAASDNIGGVQYQRVKMTVGADGVSDGDVSFSNPLPVQINGEEQTQFGEVLTAARTPVIELNGVFGVSAIRDVVQAFGSASTTDETSEIKLSSGTTASSYVALYSADRGRYIPGYSAEVGMGIRAAAQPVGEQFGEWGLLDLAVNEGFVFGVAPSGLYIRLYRGGSVFKTVLQADWNADKGDGSGPSGVDLDITDGNVFQIQFTYYGYGEIRFGALLSANGRQTFVPLHVERILGSTSINEPNLPVAVTCGNGATESNFDIYVGGRQYSIIGRYEPLYRTMGQENFAVSTTATRVPLVSLRAKSGFQNRSIKLDEVFGAVSSQDHILEVYLNATLTGASWVTPTNATAAETALESDVSATAMTGGVLIWSQPVLAGQGNQKGSLSQQVDLALPENQPITLAARTISGSGTANGFLRLVEEW